MAKEKTPSYIDYEGEEQEGSGKDVIEYFKLSLVAVKRISWLPTIKDRTLAKRIAKEYSTEQWYQMIDRWMHTAKAEHVAKFNYFYSNRHTIATNLFKPEDYGWS